ncbi:hypothetical protein FIU87_18735 [Bacillus sp. THAF10]|nr:hypothetical protein FIU87_18735 [Bacillus sp. THAF10]
MKRVLVVSFCLLGVLLLMIGKSHYDKKIQSFRVEAGSNEATWNSSLLRNMSKDVKEKIEDADEAAKLPVKLLIISSSSNKTDKEKKLTWPLQLQSELEKEYGESFFYVEVLDIKNSSTAYLVENKFQKQIISKSPDIIIMEAPLLNDHGFIKLEDSFKNISKIVMDVQKDLKDSHLIIQPSNPANGSEDYAQSVEELEALAAELRVEYLNHWEAWPDMDDPELRKYLDNMYPNAMGQELWASYFIGYFTGKK